MMFLYSVLLLIVLLVVVKLFQYCKITHFRRKGIYPRKGNTTTEDVVRLAASGKRILAIKAYREINRCSLKEAKKAVDALM